MEKRMLNEREGMEYTSLKQRKFREWCQEIGAAKKIGRRTVYDKQIIDKAMAVLATEPGKA